MILHTLSDFFYNEFGYMKNRTYTSPIDNTRIALHRQSIAFYGILTFFFILVLFVETDSVILNLKFILIVIVFLIISGIWISLRNKVKSLHAITLYLQGRCNEYDLYFNSGIDMLCIMNKTGTIIRMNPGWEQFLGLSRSRLEGSSFYSYLHPDDLEKTKTELMREPAAAGEVSTLKSRFRYADESYRLIECKFTFHNNSILTASHDISEFVKNDSQIFQPVKQTDTVAGSKDQETKPSAGNSPVNYTMTDSESKSIVFDYDGFMRRVMNDSTLARSVLNVFTNDVQMQFKILKEHSLSGNKDMIMHQAHTIKGSAANVGAEELRQTAATIEDCARRGNLSTLPDLIGKFDIQLGNLLNQISAKLLSLNDSGDSSI